MTFYELIWRIIVLLFLHNKDDENQDKSKE